MKISDIPHNMKFTFGPNLREVPVNNMEMLQGMLYLQNHLESGSLTAAEKGQVHGLLGYFLRVIGELEESKRHLTAAITMFNDLDYQRSVFVSKLRLANTYQWANEFEISTKMFDELLEKTQSDPEYSDYKDFVYEHLGKNLFDQRAFSSAAEYFNKALDIRQEYGNSELIQLTEDAIETCTKKLG